MCTIRKVEGLDLSHSFHHVTSRKSILRKTGNFLLQKCGQHGQEKNRAALFIRRQAENKHTQNNNTVFSHR